MVEEILVACQQDTSLPFGFLKMKSIITTRETKFNRGFDVYLVLVSKSVCEKFIILV
jgi:hypothetical protein